MNQRIAAGLLSVLMAAAVPDAAAQQRGGGPSTLRGRGNGGSSISGRVFDLSTNAPLRRAQVHAMNGPTLVDAITDDEGRYQLLNLSAGFWRVTVSKGGYFTWEIGQRRPFQSPPPVALAAKQQLTADIGLSRGGVIAGRVFDDSGEPLAGLRVRVYRARMAQGYRRLEAVGAADYTDDTGAYRIYGLPPGDYYVAASLRVAPADSVVQTTYSPTYYPGTGDLADAQRIRIELGTETTAVFPLLPIRSARVTGSVMTSAATPANAFLTLTSEAAELGIPLGIGGVTREDGTFTIPDVPPGRYTLTASSRGDGPEETGSIPITVVSDDLSGVTLVTGRAARIQGRLVLDDGVTARMPAGVNVIATSAGPGGLTLSAGEGPDFELDDLSEPFYLRVSELPEGWSVKSIALNGLDVTDARISLSTGQEGEAQVVITNRSTLVSGLVSSRPGSPTKAEVVVFPNDPAKWTFPSRYVRVASTDAAGRFRITGLPAGEQYLALATDYLEEGEEHDPEFLQRIRDAASPFELREADRRALDLIILER